MKYFDNDNKIPEVGKFYRVRCIYWRSEWVVIIGNLHVDKSFGPKLQHYHIDGRFSNGITNTEGKTNEAIFEPYGQLKIVIRKKKCIRSTTGSNPPLTSTEYWRWYDTMEGKSCAGKKCPHMGATMLLNNGILVCPLHNLRGCPEKEIIIQPNYLLKTR